MNVINNPAALITLCLIRAIECWLYAGPGGYSIWVSGSRLLEHLFRTPSLVNQTLLTSHKWEPCQQGLASTQRRRRGATFVEFAVSAGKSRVSRPTAIDRFTVSHADFIHQNVSKNIEDTYISCFEAKFVQTRGLNANTSSKTLAP